MLELPISRGYLATKTLSILNDSDDEIERNSVKKKRRRRNRMKLKMTSYIKKNNDLFWRSCTQPQHKGPPN